MVEFEAVSSRIEEGDPTVVVVRGISSSGIGSKSSGSS